MTARLTGIDQQEILRYLGYGGHAVPADAEADIARCAETVRRTARPRAVWRRFDLLPDGTLAGTGFRPAGEDVRAHLSGCEAAVLMAATLGGEIDALLRRAQVLNMADAILLDACASAATENVCDNLCADMAKELAPLHLTARFSPGYGDLPLSQQAELFRVLDVTRRIGVTLTDSGLMLPQKTVTAILGLSSAPAKQRTRSCETCTLSEVCNYRKDGKTCGTI